MTGQRAKVERRRSSGEEGKNSRRRRRRSRRVSQADPFLLLLVASYFLPHCPHTHYTYLFELGLSEGLSDDPKGVKLSHPSFRAAGRRFVDGSRS